MRRIGEKLSEPEISPATKAPDSEKISEEKEQTEKKLTKTRKAADNYG